MRFDWEDPEDWAKLDLTDKVQMLKSTVSMTDMVELCGHDPTSDKVRPPWNPTERTPSTHIYEDHFYDYSSGKYGDIFDWLAEEDRAQGEEPRSLGKAVSYIRRLALRGGREPGDVDHQPVRQLEDLGFVRFAEGLVPHDWEGYGTIPYGVCRDIHNGDIYVPHWEYTENGYLIYGWKFRRWNGRKDSQPGSQFTHRLYDPYGWPGPGKAGPTSHCIITEGESDCWAMIKSMHEAQVEVDVYALPSGSASWKDHWMEDLDPYDTIHLAFDNDRAGKAATEKIMRKIGYDRAKELRVPQLYNDVREAIEAGWQPSIQ